MDRHLEGYQVTVEIPLTDKMGNPIVAQSAFYRVLSGFEEVVAATSLTVTGTEFQLAIDVLAADNSLIDGETRTVEVTIQDDNGKGHLKRVSYALESVESLTFDNSYQSLAEAEKRAMEMAPMLNAWVTANDDEQVGALIEAHDRIGRLAFYIQFPDAQDRLINYSDFISDLNYQTYEGFSGLPQEFRESIYRAQVMEADDILGGDPSGELRDEGLQSKTTGESSQMFRGGKAARKSVGRRAMKILARWVYDRPVNIGRG